MEKYLTREKYRLWNLRELKEVPQQRKLPGPEACKLHRKQNRKTSKSEKWNTSIGVLQQEELIS